MRELKVYSDEIMKHLEGAPFEYSSRRIELAVIRYLHEQWNVMMIELQKINGIHCKMFEFCGTCYLISRKIRRKLR